MSKKIVVSCAVALALMLCIMPLVEYKAKNPYPGVNIKIADETQPEESTTVQTVDPWEKIKDIQGKITTPKPETQATGLPTDIISSDVYDSESSHIVATYIVTD
ncbi:MAG: hypothetical protein LBR54_03415 [Oscillospiraceae bacterium]|jgi:hypothetical protein|nr:hypothetical protein [Oscillospiraceae bacterium]